MTPYSSGTGLGNGGRSGSAGKVLRVMWLATLLASARARPRHSERTKLCRAGNASLPADVFEAFAGWECYEETYREERRLLVRVCSQRSGSVEYSVPCFKVASGTMSFNLKNEESLREIARNYGSEINDDMVRCYLNLVSACETSADGWFEQFDGCRFHLPNITAIDCLLDGQSKFHIAMLSISMIIGIPAALLFFFCSWVMRNRIMFHCSNLITALVLRTFFTLLIETEVVSKVTESPGSALTDSDGCKALAFFEEIALNIVLSSLLILTLYLLEFSKSDFETEPDIARAVYVVLGFAVVLPIIWVIIMAAGEYGNCWLERTPLQWVNDSLRIGYILIHITLMTVIIQRIMSESACNVTNRKCLLRKISLFTLLLSPLFLVQFSLNASHPVDPADGEAQIYAEYFFDGLQCAIVSLVYLFLPEVRRFVLDSLGFEKRKKCYRVFQTLPRPDIELIIPDDTSRTKPTSSPSAEVDSNNDVTYTSVLSPERFERTIKLYNRFNAMAKHEQPEIKQDLPRYNPDNSSVKSEYYDVDDDSNRTLYGDVIDPLEHPGENAKVEATAEKSSARPPANKYYSSKYLVHDADSTSSDESSRHAEEESKDGVTTEVSPSESSPELPQNDFDAKKTIEEWLRDCEGEFQDYAKRAAKAEPKPKHIYRTLSGNIVSDVEIAGLVKVPVTAAPKAPAARRNSAPAIRLVAEQPAEVMLAKKELPKIYDDLKGYNKDKAKANGRRRISKVDWSNYKKHLVNEKRRNRSLEGLQIEKDGKKLSVQLDAILSPRCMPDDHERPLKDSPFSRCNWNNLSETEDERVVRKKMKLEESLEDKYRREARKVNVAEFD